jgi:asparagine synthase (glutamine-hydrolysing)
MGGLVGVLNLEEDDSKSLDHMKSLLEKMLQMIRHRGSIEDCYLSKMVALGNRCVASADNRENRQLAFSDAKRACISIDGILYNTTQLFEQIKQGSIERNTASIVLGLYQQDGEDFIAKLNGMFAFAIWDDKKRTLILARDRFGVKPLYFTCQNGQLIFASEIKSILALEEIKRSINESAIADYFNFQTVFGDQTFFEGIRCVTPGHMLICSGNKISDKQYWDIRFEEKSELSEKHCVETLQKLLRNAVQHLIPDARPFGCHASGGTDSTSIISILAENKKSFHTFTCGFDIQGAREDENHLDERQYSRLVSEKFGSMHHEMTIGPDSFKGCLKKTLWYLDQPTGGTHYQLYEMAQFARNYVSVLLAGHGSDELLAGYYWRYSFLVDGTGSLEDDFYYYSLVIRDWTGKEKETDRESDMHLSEAFFKDLGKDSPKERFLAELEKPRLQIPLDKAMYFDAKNGLQAILTLEERFSTVAGIQTRTPFLENDLVDFMVKIPWHLSSKTPSTSMF